MSSEILFSVFNIILPHPAIQIEYGNYQLQELETIPNIFENKYILDPAELIIACEKTAWVLFDYQEYIKALPFLTLMDFISTQISQSGFYSVRAKLMKCLCLCMCGQINESVQILVKVVELKNMPLKFGRESEFLKKEQGSNWFADKKWHFNNGELFDKNKEIIDNISKLSFPQKLVSQQGVLNQNIFIFAKQSLLYKIYETEIFEKYETNETRINSLKLLKVELRELLKQLGIQEELGNLIDQYRLIVQRNSQEITSNTEGEKQKRKACEDYLQSIGISNAQEMEQRIEKGTKEECSDYNSQREERILMMCRVRYLLFCINYGMNYLTRGYYILKKGVDNLIDYCDELRLCEQGEERENEPMEAKAQIADPKKKQPPAAALKKGGKVQVSEKDKEDQERKAYEQKRAEFEKENEKVRQSARKREYRRQPNAVWFLKFRAKMCEVLFEQNRFSEAKELSLQVKEECLKLQDTFFIRGVMEVISKVEVKLGTRDSIKGVKQVIEFGARYGQDDLPFAKIVADFAELLIEGRQWQLARDAFQYAVTILEKRVKEAGYEDIVVNWNEKPKGEGVIVVRNSCCRLSRRQSF
eukprot:TRINITY_DN2497_c0_g1_i14.p1 TRINITY_DN2497_c0_g1~~TRINITY_DN2497_c0_g1_i14.p1  ORF type:complete len:587 (-),score=96.23 TRINITY_DN2497_c0_g1_i14:447-2207(-)